METKTRRLIVYICAALLLIIGLYSFIIAKDSFSGILWIILGLIFMALGYFRFKG